ncbi:hypothetical protein ACFOPN_02185 [Xanthomonas hyacinthi]|nr:hypothetical protein [Xanthomonas hyacinthi]
MIRNHCTLPALPISRSDAGLGHRTFNTSEPHQPGAVPQGAVATARL